MTDDRVWFVGVNAVNGVNECANICFMKFIDFKNTWNAGQNQLKYNS